MINRRVKYPDEYVVVVCYTYLVQNLSIREAATLFDIQSSTLHYFLSHRLPYIDASLDSRCYEYRRHNYDDRVNRMLASRGYVY